MKIISNNHFFIDSYSTALNDVISKKYLLTLFIVPSRNHPDIMWEKISNNKVEAQLIPISKVENAMVRAIGNALDYSSTAILYNIMPVIKQDNQYYTVANPVFIQGWQIISQTVKLPMDGLAATINEAANPQSKEAIELLRSEAIEQLKKETGSEHPIGMENVYSGLVFLNERDDFNKIYHYWYKPLVSFDDSFWQDGIVEFLFSPCVGIIGGTFNNYFGYKSINVDLDKTPAKSHGGFYKASHVKSISIKIYLEKYCK